MKFVYCGYDFMLDIVARLEKDGHELTGIFTFPCDNVFNFNTRTEAMAHNKKVPITFQKPTSGDIALMQGSGAEVFIAAGYLYKIPDVSPAYGINIHPALLPKGRGLMPIPFILLDHPDAAGFTIHKISDEMDAGDILAQEKLPLSETETVESLAGRIAKNAPELLAGILKDLPKNWQDAKPQDESQALSFPPPSDQMRVLNWNLPIERLDKIARAFGHYGSLAPVGNNVRVVYAHQIKKEKHDLPPGKVVSWEDDAITIAANGGFFTLKKSDEIKA